MISKVLSGRDRGSIRAESLRARDDEQIDKHVRVEHVERGILRKVNEMTKANSSEVATGRMYWVGGSKGGVGKSMATFALLDYLVERGDKVLLVDCDTSNPDAWKTYREIVPTELANLDEVDGWIHLVNVCEAHRGSAVVVNSAARNNVAGDAQTERLLAAASFGSASLLEVSALRRSWMGYPATTPLSADASPTSDARKEITAPPPTPAVHGRTVTPQRNMFAARSPRRCVLGDRRQPSSTARSNREGQY